jgi:outer membrane protein OmpA-like peptidoglycan-associated protein
VGPPIFLTTLARLEGYTASLSDLVRREGERGMKGLSRVMVPAVVLVVVSGCVSKTWVEQELDRRDARLDQGLASAQGTAAQAQRDADLAQKRLNAVDQSVSVLGARSSTLEAQSSTLDARSTILEARSADLEARTQGAWTRAEGAGARAEGVDARLTRLWATRNVRTVVNVLQVEFGFDQASLGDSAKSILFALVRELRENPELALDLEGYTDSKGSYQYNVRLSQRRVEAVRRYLVEQGAEQHRIRASARGPAADPAVPEERRRRVDIRLVIAED